MNVDSNLIELIYRAATDSTLWHSVMNKLSEKIKSDGCNLLFYDLENGAASFVHSTLDSDECLQLYAEQYASKDILRSIEHQPIGHAYVGEELVDYRTLTDSEIYQEFLGPRNRHHFMGSIFMMDGSWSGVLSSFRGQKQAAFTEQEKKLIQPYIKHLNRAFLINNQLSRQQSIIDTGSMTQDNMLMGVVMLDRQGCVVSLNANAELIIINNNLLDIIDKRLVARDIKNNRALQQMIHEAAASSLESIEPDGGFLKIVRQIRSPLRLMVMPFRSAEQISDVMGVQVYCVVFLHDPDDAPKTNIEIFARMYELTPRQIEVCEGVLIGMNLQEIADQLVVGRDTVKQHLKTIFEKTRTRKQTDLLRLMASTLVSSHHSGLESSNKMS